MKSKKKLLLLGVGAMSAMALAVGATSTFAWYQTTVNVAFTKSATGTGSLSVQASSADADQLDAEIHFFVDTAGITAKELTAWATRSGESPNYTYTVNNSTGTFLVKGTVPTGLTNNDVRLTDVTASIGSYVLSLPVKAYVTDTSSNEEKAQQDHDASWAAALWASKTTTKKVIFSYSSSDVAGVLNTNEVYFYTTEANDAYAKASEGISGATGKYQQLDVAVSELTDGTFANTKTTTGTAVTIGYLHVRFDGSQRLHSGAFTATIAAAADDGEKAVNA